MPKPSKPTSDLDQSKAGLQDDHNPRDAAQQQNDKTGGVPYRSGANSDRKNPKPEQ